MEPWACVWFRALVWGGVKKKKDPVRWWEIIKRGVRWWTYAKITDWIMGYCWATHEIFASKASTLL